jgi:hypothetical protein
MISMKKILPVCAIILGIVFIGIAFVYLLTPANGLPSFMPGYDPALGTMHFKHGLAAFLLGLLSFVYAWFATGKKN